MNDSISSGDPLKAWQRGIAAIKELAAAAAALRSDQATTLTLLKQALDSPTERVSALLLLNNIHPDFTVLLADRLVALSLSHRDALLVRQILGRLSYEQAQGVVPAAVWRQLDSTDDYDAYRRLAELLAHLGLTQSLRQLCERALASQDPDVREVGEDLAPTEHDQ